MSPPPRILRLLEEGLRLLELCLGRSGLRLGLGSPLRELGDAGVQVLNDAARVRQA